MENTDNKLVQFKPQYHKKKRTSKKRILVIVFAPFVVLALVGVAIWYFILKTNTVNTDKADQVIGTYSVMRQAEMAANSGKTDRSLELYKQAISDSKDDSAKLDIKIKMVVVLINSERYDEAMVLAREIEAERQDANICNLIINIYTLQGRQQEADDYYNSVKSSVVFEEDPIDSPDTKEDGGN